MSPTTTAAGQHDGCDVSIALQRLQLCDQVPLDLQIQSVAALRPLDSDDADPASALAAHDAAGGGLGPHAIAFTV